MSDDREFKLSDDDQQALADKGAACTKAYDEVAFAEGALEAFRLDLCRRYQISPREWQVYAEPQGGKLSLRKVAEAQRG